MRFGATRARAYRLASRRHPQRARGFTLLELAIVLVVVGLTWTIGSYALPWLYEGLRLANTGKTMEEVQEALLAYARTNHRLPCPDVNGDGFEGTAGSCAGGDVVGRVPYETLLLPGPVLDTAHQPITYAVYRNAAASADLAANPVINLVDNIDEAPGTLNAYDFCRALNNGNAGNGAPPLAGTGFASVSTSITAGGCAGGTFLNQAYVLSSSGLEDADGDANVADGYNADATAMCFSSPQQGRDAVYDDVVSAVSFGALMGQLCP